MVWGSKTWLKWLQAKHSESVEGWPIQGTVWRRNLAKPKSRTDSKSETRPNYSSRSHLTVGFRRLVLCWDFKLGRWNKSKTKVSNRGFQRLRYKSVDLVERANNLWCSKWSSIQIWRPFFSLRTRRLVLRFGWGNV